METSRGLDLRAPAMSRADVTQRAAARRVTEHTAFWVEQTDGNEKSSLDEFAGNVKESTDLSWRREWDSPARLCHRLRFFSDSGYPLPFSWTCGGYRVSAVFQNSLPLTSVASAMSLGMSLVPGLAAISRDKFVRELRDPRPRRGVLDGDRGDLSV